MERKRIITMGTDIRTEISKKNKYWISKDRYLELKHFCLQYPEWRKEYREIKQRLTSNMVDEKVSGGLSTSPTEESAIRLAELDEKINLVEDTVIEADEFIGKWIFPVVTGVASYEFLKNKVRIPVSRSNFYDKYRKFFWLLSKKR